MQIQIVRGTIAFMMTMMVFGFAAHDFVLSTVSAGRGPVMPTWLDQFGGPLRPDQVQNVTNFVLNWESEELCAQPVVTFPWAETVEEFLADQAEAEGDPANGEELFMVTYGCASCHGNLEDETSALLGPWLGNIETEGATRVEGMSAEQYVYHSILYPNDFIAPDCPTGPCTEPSVMPADFGQRMGENPQDMADILAFLLGE
jgi:hypothetical protein